MSHEYENTYLVSNSRNSYGSVTQVDILNDGNLKISTNISLERHFHLSKCTLQNVISSFIFSLCIIIGPLNFVLYKILFTTYTDKGSYFVIQSINFLYVVFGSIFLKYCYLNGEISQNEHLKVPMKTYVLVGFLDSFAGFLSGISASNVSGGSQQLLNQALIPCTMLASYIFLGTKSSLLQILGGIVIVIGTFIVILPEFKFENVKTHHSLSSVSHVHLISIFIYTVSNIPFAASYVIKEYNFKNLSIHVIYLTQWVSIYQLIFGFVFIPLQILPCMGSSSGMKFDEIINEFINGFYCFLELNHICRKHNAFLLLIAYCLVNFTFNILGLYLCKHASAILNSISYAIILPFATLAFSLPILGRFQEFFDIATLIGLIVILFGFFLWKFENLFNKQCFTSVYEIPAENILLENGNLFVKTLVSNQLLTKVKRDRDSKNSFVLLELDNSFENLVDCVSSSEIVDSSETRTSRCNSLESSVLENSQECSAEGYTKNMHDAIANVRKSRNRVNSFNERMIVAGFV